MNHSAFNSDYLYTSTMDNINEYGIDKPFKSTIYPSSLPGVRYATSNWGYSRGLLIIHKHTSIQIFYLDSQILKGLKIKDVIALAEKHLALISWDFKTREEVTEDHLEVRNNFIQQVLKAQPT